jgi:undecaprenyl-phosphate galactose phosphotransferase/putative colanic acid biosynthesis UDP-glucose lipid carrier transferase
VSLPHCAWPLASFIHILRISGTGYYDFPDCASPAEIGAILVCWFTTGLLLAFFAFLKVGVAYSRGAFVIFYFVTPVGLLERAS